jgi:hypothetical protein
MHCEVILICCNAALPTTWMENGRDLAACSLRLALPGTAKYAIAGCPAIAADMTAADWAGNPRLTSPGRPVWRHARTARNAYASKLVLEVLTVN